MMEYQLNEMEIKKEEESSKSQIGESNDVLEVKAGGSEVHPTPKS